MNEMEITYVIKLFLEIGKFLENKKGNLYQRQFQETFYSFSMWSTDPLEQAGDHLDTSKLYEECRQD
jgi:hypothetical protein